MLSPVPTLLILSGQFAARASYGAQRGEMLIVGLLDTNYLVLIGCLYTLCWYFLRFSG